MFCKTYLASCLAGPGVGAVADGEDAVVELDGGAVGAAEDAALVEHELAVRRVDRHRDGTDLRDRRGQRGLVPGE